VGSGLTAAVTSQSAYSSRHQIACFKVIAKSYSVAIRTVEPSSSQLAAYRNWQRCTVDLEPRGKGISHSVALKHVQKVYTMRQMPVPLHCFRGVKS
jgi:hypothetical protein